MTYAALKPVAIEAFCEAHLAIEYNVLALTLILSGAFA